MMNLHGGLTGYTHGHGLYEDNPPRRGTIGNERLADLKRAVDAGLRRRGGREGCESVVLLYPDRKDVLFQFGARMADGDYVVISCKQMPSDFDGIADDIAFLLRSPF